MIKDSHDVKFPIFSSSKVLPASITVAEACNIPFGFVFDPNLPQHAASDGTVKRCSNCKAYINKFCRVNNASWKCVLCKRDNEITDSVGISPAMLERESYSVVIPGENTPRKHVIFVIDDYLSIADKIPVLSSIIKYVESTSDRTLVSVFVLSSVLNIYMVGKAQSPMHSEVFSGTMTRDLLKYLALHSRDMFCDLSTSRSSLLEMLHNLIEGLQCKQTALSKNSPFLKRNSERLHKGAPKCIGFMFELIVAIISQDTKLEAVKHILLFTGGELPLPTLPLSSFIEQNKQYFASLGTSLSKRKTATHVHCIGNAVYGLDKMKTMIENCGGSISWQVELTGEVDVAKCVDNAIGYDCVIRLQTSDNINISNVSGECYQGNLFTKRYPVLSRDKKLSAHLDIGNRINLSPVFLQCTNSYTDTFQCAKVTHVSTVRYDCLVDHDEIMGSMCPDTVFALSARAYFRVLHQRKESSEVLLQQARSLVSSSHGAERVKKVVEMYLEKVYFLLNGPVISRMLQQRDVQFYMLHLLCRASVQAAAHLFKPRLYALTAQMGMESFSVVEYPPVTPVMRSDRLLILDSLTHISIWIGSSLSEDRADRLLSQSRVFVEQLTLMRYPRPSVAVIHDATANNRFLECFLVPLHKDSKDIQESILPELAELEEADYKQLMTKFLHITSKSFYQWLQEIRVLSPPSVLP